MKPGKTFNLSKQTKRFMATIVDPVARHAYKNAMIQAQLASEVVVKREPRDNKGGARGTGYSNTATSATPST
jgi:hypothetical protein